MKITKEYILDKNRIIEPETSEIMLIVLVLAPVAMKQAVIPKSMVPDPE